MAHEDFQRINHAYLFVGEMRDYLFLKKLTCDNSRVAPSSCDPPDTSRFTEVTQLLRQKHVFLMAKAKLPIAVCTLGLK